MTRPPQNPFGELIVQDPRRREPSVPGLNERPLFRLLDAFERLVGDDLPRPLRSGGQALLVTSADPGYGKSHLIGRLFHALHGRATLVYVQPFQNPAAAFHSLLLATVREMHFPDRLTLGPRDPEEPSQLDCLAVHLLAHLLADLTEGRAPLLEIDAPPETLRLLRGDPYAAFQRGADPWAGWMVENWETLEPFLEEALSRRGVDLERPSAWLRVLRSYAFAPDDPALRRACLEWLMGQPLEPDEVARIGLRPSEAGGESSPSELNALCRTRLVELCQLSCFFRPFVFCFDQTEVYGHQPALSRAFGLVVATLVNEARGALTLITANQEPWQARIVRNLELADADRIAKPPVTLEGLSQAQAVELARLRLTAARAEPGRVEAFLRGPWLAELFPGEGSQLSPRVFLQKCQERWSQQPVREFTLAELYGKRRELLLASPKRQHFEPDPLQWLVEVAARGLPGIAVETVDDPHFPVEWRTPERRCLFGFLTGSHWKQWRAVTRASVERSRVSATPVKCVLFRGPDQPEIPGEHWVVRAEIEAARREFLQLIVLTAPELAALYATRDLYAQAAQGDIAYTPEEVVDFLHEALAAWWARLSGPIA